jgi:hypothetical protein
MGLSQVEVDPYWAALAAKGMLLTNFHAITHPSQPNYWCQVAGDYFSETNNNVDLNVTTVVDLLENKGVPWKGYMEDYPGNCFDGVADGVYRRKHNPFISFDSIRLNQTRCAKIVNARELESDLRDFRDLPLYSYYTPNMQNDGHDTGTEFAGIWATTFFEEYYSKFPNGTLFVFTWDESNYHVGTNQIWTFLIGSMITPGTSDHTYFDHYSLLKTVESNWDLGSLGRNDDADVNLFNFGEIPTSSSRDSRLLLVFGPHTMWIGLGLLAGLSMLIAVTVLVFNSNARAKVGTMCGKKKDYVHAMNEEDSSVSAENEQSIDLETTSDSQSS